MTRQRAVALVRAAFEATTEGTDRTSDGEMLAHLEQYVFTDHAEAQAFVDAFPNVTCECECKSSMCRDRALACVGVAMDEIGREHLNQAPTSPTLH